MTKFVVLYRTPPDVDRFERAYFDTHLPLLKKTPGLGRTEVLRVTRMVVGEPEYYLMAEMEFSDDEALRSALRSPEWAAAGENLQSFGGLELSTMFVARPADLTTQVDRTTERNTRDEVRRDS